MENSATWKNFFFQKVDEFFIDIEITTENCFQPISTQTVLPLLLHLEIPKTVVSISQTIDSIPRN